MKVDKEVYEFLTWDVPTNSVVKNIEAIILNSKLHKVKFSVGLTASVSSSPGYKNFELSLKNPDSNVQVIRKLYEVFEDLLNFIDGKPLLLEKTKDDRKRMIQVRDVKTTTFGDDE